MLPEILVCDCNSNEHQIIIYFDEELGSAYLQIHLTKRKFWQRLKAGIKYIFGYKSRFGHWDEFIFKPEHASKLKEIAEKISRPTRHNNYN
jgi:hypothetical protein